MDFDLFFVMPFTIEFIFPEWTLVRVCLVITMIIQAFEHMQTQFTFLCFKLGRVDFVICLVTLSKLTMMFSFLQTTALDTFRFLDPTWVSCVTPPPTVLTLEHTWIHVYVSDSGNMVSYIKTLINEFFGLATTLNILYIHLNNEHV